MRILWLMTGFLLCFALPAWAGANRVILTEAGTDLLQEADNDGTSVVLAELDLPIPVAPILFSELSERRPVGPSPDACVLAEDVSTKVVEADGGFTIRD